jgi:polyvinyl alcohol dehydrogenase (cytochrome)
MFMIHTSGSWSRDLEATPARAGRRRDRRRSSRPRLEVLERRECLSGPNWAMYSYDPRGSRDITVEHTLNASNVSQVGQFWSFPTAAPVAGTPAVFRNAVFVGDEFGNFYALNRSTGALIWQVNVGTSVTDSPLVTPQGTVVFGDLAGNVWGLNWHTGATLWQIHPSNDVWPYTAIWGSPTQVGNDIVVGTASNQEGAPGQPSCLGNGSVVMIDPKDGNILWQTYMIPPDAYAAGWTGAGVWSTPTFDRRTDTVYVTTGNY